MRKKIVIGMVIISFIYLLHSTPNLALRTYVFVTGYPISALTTEIIDDEYHNTVDKEKYDEMNARAYTLTKPPIEKATQGELRNYLVKKFGFFYVVEFYGEG
ncbi:hypothetical protein [Alkalihalobacterium elongatum]|uniref:hypothetical protein n=1 Tax=Alkalihalobacterium elongatum TaxID=2675466 RepID=UPI001C1FA8F4|nr:hypothetical protein [Alkalihalobacterium elongatum]